MVLDLQLGYDQVKVTWYLYGLSLMINVQQNQNHSAS